MDSHKGQSTDEGRPVHSICLLKFRVIILNHEAKTLSKQGQYL